jgi:hypothetical protein
MFQQVTDGAGDFRAHFVKTVHVAVALLIKSSQSHRVHLCLLIYGHAIVAIVDLYLLLYHPVQGNCRLQPLKNLSTGSGSPETVRLFWIL